MLAHWPAPPTIIGRRMPPDAPGPSIITDLQTDTAPLAVNGSDAILLHLAPVWLLPALLARWPAALPPARIIALSSISARTKAASGDAHERALSEQLREGEAKAFEAAAELACSLLILRCTLIYGVRGTGVVGWLASQADRFGCIPLPPAANGLRQPVHAADIATALLRLATHHRALNGIHDLGGGERLAFRAMAGRVPRADGRPCRVLTVPAMVLRLLLSRANTPGAGTAALARLALDHVAQDDSVWREIGMTPRAFRPDA